MMSVVDRRASLVAAVKPFARPPVLVTAALFAALFWHPCVTLLRDWIHRPEAGHGLLLAPVAGWLLWRDRRAASADLTGSVILGALILTAAVSLRYAGGLAAELFSTRVSVVLALIGLAVYFRGVRLVQRWWLPFALLCLAIPLPELVTQALALPLQFKASQLGASLLEMRSVPVRLSGNVIRIPGHDLFVTEACSGLRSLTALISTAILISALVLQTPITRIGLVLLAIPIAILVNGVRVFATGFLVYFVNPSMGSGFMHATEGWLLFLVSLVAIGGLASVGAVAERWVLRSAANHA
jgi:exosortase